MSQKNPPLPSADERWKVLQRALAKKSVGQRDLEDAVRELSAFSQAAHEAAQVELWQGTHVLVQLLELATIWRSQPDADAGPAAELLDFVRDCLPALARATRSEADAAEDLERYVSAAHQKWSDYLECLDAEHSVAAAGEESWENVLAGLAEAEATLSDQVAAELAVSLESEGPLPDSQFDLLLSVVQAGNLDGTGSQGLPTGGADDRSFDLADARSIAALDEFPSPSSPAIPDELIHDQVILEAYLDDAVRCLASMEKSTLAVEANPQDREALHQFCRELHTLKGASGTVGLAKLASDLHQLESSLAATASLGSIHTAVESMLGAVDRMRDEIARLRGKPTPPATPRREGEGEGWREGSTRNAQREFAPVAAGDDALIRIRASKLDRLMDMLAELVVLRNRRESHVAEFNECNEELSRCASRLAFAEEHPHWHESEGSAGGAVSVLRSGSKTLSEIARDLTVVSRGLRELQKPLAQDNLSISHFIRDFRQELMQLRRVPLTGLFQRLQRAARDAARRESKQVQLKVLGEDAGIEQELQERLFEPLLHIIRNAVSHGIEPEAQRLRSGKPPAGTITLETQASPQLLVIEITDDGQGLNYDAIRRRAHEKGLLTSSYQASTEELARLIFQPGFSTRDHASEVSGRGLGMDVVANTLDQLRGRIDIDSVPGRGTTMRLSIPLRSGIEHVMVFRAAGQLFALPMQSVAAARAGHVALEKHGNCSLARLFSRPGSDRGHDGEVLLLRQLNGLFAKNPAGRNEPALNESLGLIVDEIVGPEEVVVRGLPALLKRHPMFCGLTLSGAGETVLLLDSNRLVEFHQRFHSDPAESAREEESRPHPAKGAGRVLVVDDSLSARKMLVKKLNQLGFSTIEAGDGFEGLEKLRHYKFDLVLTDLDMPRLGGIEMLFDMQRGHYGEAPVVVVTSRNEEEIRSRALENGAVEYLTKPVSDEALHRVLTQLELLQPES